MPSKDYVYKTFGDNQECAATVHYDDSDKSSKAVAIACHGGGFSTGWKEMIPLGQIDWLVKNGFVVVAYNYRLCPNVSYMDGPIGDSREVYHWSRTKLPGLMKNDIGLDVDGERVVVFGGSAGGTITMALGHESPRPKALLDFYGALYFDDQFWTQPPNLPLPDFDPAVVAKVFEEPVQTSTDPQNSDFSNPRTAWLCDKLKHGKLVEALCSGHFDECDPATMKGGLTKDFPPTFFCHGKEDPLVTHKIAERCCEELKALGVDTGIAVAEMGGHGYDTDLKEGDEAFENGVKLGLEFLKKHV